MKKQIVRLIVIVCFVVIPELNARADTADFISDTPIFTNAVTTFIDVIKDIGFSLERVSFSCGDRTKGRETATEVINDVNLFFVRNNDSGIAVTFCYSETEFAATRKLTEWRLATSASGRLPPTNSTYRTDFTVLTHQDNGNATRHASVLLLSSDLAADIRVSSDKDDISKDMVKVISEVEVLRKNLRRQKEKK